MPALEIKKYPASILRKKSEEIKEIREETRSLIFEMKELLEKAGGLGLAGPQVGELKRIIVIKLDNAVKGFINPKILKKSRNWGKLEEGCLSFPGIWLKIRRAKEIEIIAINEENQKIQMVVEGLSARIFQHEIDHLDGISFIERAPLWQRIKARKALKELEKRYGS
ncbi:MAG: peptide deformylase [Candidatus Nealsonbacteria bacterium CG08_land_8_20_14_0_20_43_11]|uniref:Peptide deformylase n=1 Tax=Candidatus Nealsonbacteria bacterium CG08_land_8_20_14_0_20_43_11 TaxID=1974706 RepID=A0A2M6T150_9BACT|nr:MAG: peptide deformylase [Candidatus Nealsonbacteria bacterium CG08_land_8_20_14_0_20_43_11]